MLRLTHKSAAFTLVELLVSIAIIGALVSLLIPSVQAARESSRRLACVNNQKQIGLAVVNYESVHKELPTAGTYASPKEAVSFFDRRDWRVDLKSGSNYSWLVQILPFLEESNLFDRLDLDSHITKNEPKLLKSQPSVFSCSSDEAADRFYTTSDEDYEDKPITQFGKGNYAGFSNPFHVDSFYQAGPLAHYGVRLQKITDGISSTLLLTEVRTRDVADDQRGAWMLPWAGSSLLSLDLHPLYYGRSTIDDDPNKYDFSIAPFTVGLNQTPNSRHADVLYHCSDLAGAQFEGLPCNNLWRLYISAAPRSLHPGGVNVGFLDGRVQFLSDDVDEVRMLYMINISDGEVVPSE